MGDQRQAICSGTLLGNSRLLQDIVVTRAVVSVTSREVLILSSQDVAWHVDSDLASGSLLGGTALEFPLRLFILATNIPHILPSTLFYLCESVSLMNCMCLKVRPGFFV